MPLPRRKMFGWYDERHHSYRLSALPPDAPVRSSLGFEDKEELREYLRRKRIDVAWHPPLTVEHEIAAV